jgi:solute carrier family 50 protein (sugar transporter)
MLYGYVTNDIFPLLATYAIGDLLSIFYVSFFYYWSTEKRYALKICAVSFTVNVIMAIYAVMGYHLQDHELVINIVGTTAIAASVFFYASPLTTIRKVIRTKNAASIPFEMLLVGALNNILWIIYGTLIHDMLLISPSIISVSLASTQLILYAIYRPRGKNTHNLQAVVPRKEEKDNYKSNSNPMKIHAAEQECPEFVDNQLPTDRIQVKI